MKHRWDTDADKRLSSGKQGSRKGAASEEQDPVPAFMPS
jgi:hypothetical protein